MFRLTAIFLIFLAAFTVTAGISQAEYDTDHLELLIPHAESSLEKERFEAQEYFFQDLELRDSPPFGPIRNCAEWEPTTGVMIRYPLGLPYNLLRDMDDQVKLHVVVSSGYESSAASNMAANGVDMDQVEFLVRNNDSIWTRDYGPWFIFTGDNQIGIVNHTYNRPWRPNDNQIPYYFALQQEMPVYNHSMYHTGGNYMTDGSHISSSTMLVYNEAYSENGMTPAQVDDLMNVYYGLETYSVLDYIENGGIHHIDTWAKFLDEETVLVKDVWPSHHTHNALDQRAALLASLTASTGRPYQVHRIYCYNFSGGNPASYTNSLILNDHIYVPLFGNSSYDQAALQIYRDAAPGYQVSGYQYGGFLTDDALHCRTKGIMDAGMLRVEHIPVRENQMGDAIIEASVHAHSGQTIETASVFYRHDQGLWNELPMELVRDNLYRTEIAGPATASDCQYYIAVNDASGRQEGMPRSQPSAWYTFAHETDLSPVNDDLEISSPKLAGNFPNPFNPSTTFRFTLAHEGQANLTVIDTKGRIIKNLVSGIYPAGDHQITWNGKDNSGRNVPSGVYLYQLRAAGLQYTRTATLVK
ncbi:MAG: T9SS type A sorting domain-containing protein [bacterium]|nr:T9SS type A sorting domain-containing protein [bacterium]